MILDVKQMELLLSVARQNGRHGTVVGGLLGPGIVHNVSIEDLLETLIDMRRFMETIQRSPFFARVGKPLEGEA